MSSRRTGEVDGDVCMFCEEEGERPARRRMEPSQGIYNGLGRGRAEQARAETARASWLS